MSLQLTPELEQRLESLATAIHRSPDELANEALEDYVQRLETLKKAVRTGQESAERDGWLTTEEVFDRLNRRLLRSA
jgi:predicted transcriptional regulator